MTTDAERDAEILEMTCKAFLENAAQLEIERLTKENGELKAEVARLSASPGADAMELARYAAGLLPAIYAQFGPSSDGAVERDLITAFARAIEAAEIAKGHVWNETVKVEVLAAQRSARAQMREEAATVIPDNYQFSEYPDLQRAAWHAVATIRGKIRALPDDPSKFEGEPT